MGIIENVPAPPFTALQERTYRYQVEALTRQGLTHGKVVSILVQVVCAASDLKAHQVFAWFVRESRAIRSDLIEVAQADAKAALDRGDFDAARDRIDAMKALTKGGGKS